MSLELEEVRPIPPLGAGETENERPISALPPADRGSEAWKFLCGCFVLEAILWGFPLTFGVFQEHYARLPQFANDQKNIAVIGTVATSMVFLGGPFATAFVKRFHAWQRTMLMTGTSICILSLVAASFATTIPGLIATQGALYGTGFLILYYPIPSMINEWFIQRRGLAYGVLFAGGGVAGVGFPFLNEWLLSRYGYQTTLRVVAVVQACCMGPTMFLLKGRLPSSARGAMARVEFAFLRKPEFWVLAASNILQGFAFYIPSLFLPTFATYIGLSPRVGALLLAANNLSSTLGQVILGHVSDRFSNVFVLVFASSFTSALASLCIWGFAHSLAPLLIYAIVFGLFGGAYVVLWPKFASMLSEDTQTVYSLMCFGKGIGNIATGPIAGKLLSGPVSSGYGIGRFEALILYTGTLLLGSSLGIAGWPITSWTSTSISRR